ncbi:MAG TPA: nucleotidyltransferase domain-containing protein [Trebonia sp.]|nr:nucleotidyltransferase domain-containing protein [Trebonia sp.]
MPSLDVSSRDMSSHRLVSEKLASVQDAVDRYLADESVQAVCLSGSLMAGLGTPYSDIDIFVVTTDRSGESQHGRGQDRLGVEFRSPEWLYQVADLARPFAATLDDNYPLTTSSGLIEDAVRLKIGRELKNSPELARVKSTLDAGRRNLQKVVISQVALDLASYWMDILGFLTKGDIDSAEMMSVQILLTALDAACIPDDDLYRGAKWIWSRARRSESLAPARPWIRNLLLPHLGTGPMSRPLCMDRMLAAQKLISLALLREWDPDRFLPTPEAAPSGGGDLVRSPYWQVFRVEKSAVLTYQDTRHYELPDLALYCWYAADGCSAAEIEKSVALTYPDSVGRIAEIVNELRRIGAIGDTGDWENLFRPAD